MRQPNDPVREHMVRVLDWEDAHIGFDKAVAGIPSARSLPCIAPPVCGPRARRYLAPGVVLVPGVPSCLSNSATAVSSCESLPV